MRVRSVRFTDEIDDLLDRLARETGRDRSDLVREAVRALAAARRLAPARRRPIDRIRDLVGVVDGGPSDLSVKTGEGFRRTLVPRTIPRAAGSRRRRVVP
jgi:Arc/MetJ-type ribon-helix-helix transcriptional regulator